MDNPGSRRGWRGEEQAFMLRIWKEELSGSRFDWRGRIQHINSGEALFFHDWQALTSFIQKMLADQTELKKNR